MPRDEWALAFQRKVDGPSPVWPFSEPQSGGAPAISMRWRINFPETTMTPWFVGSANPGRVGVYMTTIAPRAHSYSLWDGYRWQELTGWLDHSESPDFKWRGLLERH
jgi:hypothetical protein